MTSSSPSKAGTEVGRRVLLIEDDANLVRLLQLHLADLGCSTESAPDGTTGLRMASEEDFGLIVLDIMLPGMDGLEILRRLRSRKPLVPILMLTARSEEMDKVLGLELGADDYLTKPFGIRELLARVRALFRRAETQRETAGKENLEELRVGNLVIRPGSRTVIRGGEQVALTTREFELLHFLASNAGRAYSRAQLLDAVWGYQYEGYEHTVNTHINRLRSKIEIDPVTPLFIETVWGFGYRFAETIG